MTESFERPSETDSAGSDHHETVIAEALGIVDHALAQMVSRELVSGGEVADLLLDLRSALTTAGVSSAADVSPSRA